MIERFQNILVYVDGEAERSFAFQCALQLAGTSGAKLKIVAVLEQLPWYTHAMMPESKERQFLEIFERDLEQRLEKLAQEATEAGITAETKLLRGRGTIEIVREVQKSQHDLVIADAQEPDSHAKPRISPFGMRLLRKCPAPVWLVKTPPSELFDRVLAAVSPSAEENQERHDLNVAILQLARKVAEMHSARLDIMRAWSVYGERILRSNMNEEQFEECVNFTHDRVKSTLDSFIASAGDPVADEHVHLVKGDPEIVIPQFVEKERIDLVVMGTVARSGVAGLVMGNTAETILSSIGCSVLAIKPAGFLSPIPHEG